MLAMFSLAREIERLRDDGVIPAPAAAALLGRERREVVSIYAELRFLTWAGVMLIVSGVGVLVSKNLDRIGPLVIAGAIGLAAAGCYAYAVWRRGRAASLVDDYVLLLGSLLLSADLGYVEHQFHLLGSNWQRHLLILAIVHAAVAYFFGSRMVLSLSLTSLAAWMGLERNVETIFDSSADTAARAFGCAALVFGWRMIDAGAPQAAGRRPRAAFTSVFDHFAANLAFWGALALAFERDTRWAGCAIAVVLACASAWYGVRTNAEVFVIYAWIYGVIAIDVAVVDVIDEPVLAVFWIVLSTIGAIVGLFAIHSRMKASE